MRPTPKASRPAAKRPVRTLRNQATQPSPGAPAPAPAPSPPATTPDEPAPEVPSTPTDEEAGAAPTQPEVTGAKPADTLTDEDLLRAIAEEEEAKEPEVIVITGSVIERKELTTTAPVSVLDREDLQGAGLTTVGDIIQNLPSQSNAINAQVNNGGDGATRVSLRGLGSARTLTLLNGRRIVPGGTGADASVDLNSIPLAMIERIEVLKDGASAVYGSDAIGGVVNVITRSDFEGSEAAVYTGTSERGDGLAYDVSLVTGRKNDKGSIVFSAGFQQQGSVMAGDRGFSAYDRNYNYEDGTDSIGGSTSTPFGRVNADSIDADGDGVPDGGYDLCGTDEQYCTRNPDGTWRPFTNDDFYNYQPENYLYTPSQRYNIFSTGTYELGHGVEAFFEASYLNRTSDQRLAPEPFVSFAPISADSIHNPLGVTIYGYNRRLSEFGPRRALQDIDTFRFVGGLTGKFTEDEERELLSSWKWELSYNFGRTQAQQTNEGNLIVSRLANALGDSYVDANGVAHCGTEGNEIAGCVPMNILGNGGITQAMRDYVTYTGVSGGYNEQRTMLATAHGQLVKTPWGGDISLAVGGDYRDEGGGFTPDPLTSTGDTTGNAQAPTDGSYNVIEGFAEISAVPVAGKKFAKWVELNAAARGFRYNTFGSGLTWKAGGLFRTVGGLAVRGTYSTAFRAPSVAELYQGSSEGFPAAEDPCDTSPPSADGETITLEPHVAERCAAQGVAADAVFGTSQQRAIFGGNPGLEAETAKTLTAGLVLEPPAVKGLSLTLDYFNIDISDAIQSKGASLILTNCYERGIEEDCNRIHRDPLQSNAIDYIDDPSSNVGGTATRGIDFAVAYAHHAGEHNFRHQFEGSYLLSMELDNSLQILEGKGNYDLGAFPSLKTNFTSTWSHKGYGAGVNVRYIGGFDECKESDCNGGAPSRDVPVNVTADLFGSLSFKGTAGITTLALGINNLTDQDPSLIYSGFAADSDASTYDYMGRFYYMRLSQRF
jgi:iron complex outermembrane recepter protein